MLFSHKYHNVYPKLFFNEHSICVKQGGWLLVELIWVLSTPYALTLESPLAVQEKMRSVHIRGFISIIMIIFHIYSAPITADFNVKKTWAP